MHVIKTFSPLPEHFMPRIAAVTPDGIRSSILAMSAEVHDHSLPRVGASAVLSQCANCARLDGGDSATLGRAIKAKMANSKTLIY